MNKRKKKKIYKKVFENIILGIVVTLYFIGIGIGFLNIDGPTFITDLKVFSLSILAIAIILFEFAYGKDDDKTALYGVEMLFVAIMSLVLLYTCILHKDKFIAVANIVACIGVLYYLVKSISIYIREKLKWKKTIPDRCISSVTRIRVRIPSVRLLLMRILRTELRRIKNISRRERGRSMRRPGMC